jgi:adenine-specific DNA-methyltransferase
LVWEDKPEDVEEQLRENLPVLKEVKDRAIINGEEYPNHILIEGDNLHALTTLTFTNEGKIDVIYIDPPYNTGNKDFKYNDTFVDKEDSYRHSKWLSFISKRLEIAKRLLSDKGVIFISLDDNQQAQLKILCDEVFGEANFISNAIVETATDNNPRQIAIEHEYLIAYAKNLSLHGKWGIVNYGAELIQKEYGKLKVIHQDDYTALNKDLKMFIKNNQEELDKYKVTHYQYADENGVYFRGDVSNTKLGGYDIDLIHPITKKVCKKPPNGYRFKYETLMKMVEVGDIDFGEDESKIVTVKRRMNEIQEKFRSIYYEDGRGATSLLKTILGKKAFNNPKSIKLISRILQFASHDKAKVLDFFAGSGTTLHATMQLNTEDGGNRQCILVTNNENNICEEVTYERNKRVIQGYTNTKGEKVEGLANNNLRYYKSVFVGREPSIKNKKEITRLATELLCIKEDIYAEQKQVGDYQLNTTFVRCFQQGSLYLLVIYDEDVIEQIVEVIQNVIEADKERKTQFKVYVFSNGQYPYTEEFEEVLPYVSLCALPDAIYKTYQNVLPNRKKITTPVLEEDVLQALENQSKNTPVTLFS